MEHLARMLSAAGMQLAQTDPEKLAKAQDRDLSADAPRGRERPRRGTVEETPLVQVETQRPQGQ
jgi:hypothetical protein